MKKYYKVLFSTALISALGFSLMVTLSNASRSMNSTFDKYIKEYNYPEVEIKTSPSTIDKVTFLDNIDGIESHSEQFIFDTILQVNNKYHSIIAFTYD